MSQNAFSESNESGASYRAGINSALQALASTNSGNSAPATAYAQQMWVDTDTPSSTVWTLNMYDGTDWIPLGYIDSTNNVLLPFIGGGTATLSSASTVDLGATQQSAITISGTVTITSFGTTMKPGQSKIVIASGAWQLTYNATSMKIPGSANYTMASGDKLIITCVSAGNYDVMVFPKSGQSVAVGVNKVLTYLVTDSTDISLSTVPTQANVGSTFSMTLPTKGFIQWFASFESISTVSDPQIIFGLRIGSTNYWPTNSFSGNTYYAESGSTNQAFGTDVYSSFGVGQAQLNSSNSADATTAIVGISIEQSGIPTGSQTVQLIAGKLLSAGGTTGTLKGTVVTTRVYVETHDYS